jgi:hypothetical protein
MESEPTPAHQTLEIVFPFLRNNEWEVLVKVLKYYVRGANTKNIRNAAPFWTDQWILREQNTHYAWEQIIAKLDTIKEAMSELPGYITSQNHYLIRSKCDCISETIVTIVYDFTEMHEGFIRYLHDKGYMTVKMKYFRQGPNGLWGGVHVKCGKLFGGVQDLHLLSFLHRIYEVFLLPPDPDPDAYPRRRCTWPDTATIPANFRYRERPSAMLIQNPDGTPSVAMPVPRDDRLDEHSMRSDSSGDEREDSDDELRGSVRTWHFGHDSPDDSEAQLQSMLRDLKQLSVL